MQHAVVPPVWMLQEVSWGSYWLKVIDVYFLIIIAENTEQIDEKNEKSLDSKDEYESSFAKRRRNRVSEAEKRHCEKMQRLDRFNDIFSKLVEKISPENGNS